MSPLPEAQIVDGISQNALLSIELWAASKIIGRECASVNGAFYHCKSLKVASNTNLLPLPIIMLCACYDPRKLLTSARNLTNLETIWIKIRFSSG